MRIQTPFMGYEYVTLAGKVSVLGVTATLLVPSSDLNAKFIFTNGDEGVDLDTSISTSRHLNELKFHLDPTDSKFNATIQMPWTESHFSSSAEFNIDSEKGTYKFNLLFDIGTNNIRLSSLLMHK